MVVSNVQTSGWKVVALDKTYISPIAVCTVRYDNTTTMLPVVVRMRNVGTKSLEIRLQNPNNAAIQTPRQVNCVVVEEGRHKLPDGRIIVASKYESTVTDRKNSWIGEAKSMSSAVNQPIVLGQVMTFNDARWSVFWCRGSTVSNAPIPNQLFMGKHVGKDGFTVRLAETIGYIVLESGRATSSGIEIEARRGPRTVADYTSGTFMYPFTTPFAAAPRVAILSQVTMSGNDGSWPLIKANPSTTSMFVAVDEDQTTFTERIHPVEILDYAVFSATGPIVLRPL
jgi:hypothetical protein